MKLTWLGHASFRLEGKSIIYLDPYKVGGGPKADLILISHSHYDHCDVASIKTLTKDETAIICPESCGDKVYGTVTFLEAGQEATVEEVLVEAHPAYNTNKPNHPRGFGLGYVVESSGKRIYFAGDTDLIPEMRGVGRIDLAILPVGGTYTMDWREAVEAVGLIKPKFAVPMHYGEVVGSVDDALKFRGGVESMGGTKVHVLKRGDSLML